MVKKHLSTMDEPSSLFDVGFEHLEKISMQSKEKSIRFAIKCGSNMLEAFIKTAKEIFFMLKSKLCISAVIT